MKFTKEQADKHQEMMQKLKDVSTYLNTTKPIEHSLNNAVLANKLSQIKYVLAGGKIDTILSVSKRVVGELALDVKPKRGRKKKTV